jgi:hypothetical protein
MSKAIERMSFEEFSENLDRIFERIVVEGESIVIEKGDGELVEVKPVSRAKSAKRAKTKADYEAFLASAGSWSDVDVDTFLEDNYASRSVSTRSAVEL